MHLMCVNSVFFLSFLLLQLFSLLDMHTQISLSLPSLSKMLTPPQPAPTSRRSSYAGSATGSISSTTAAAAGGAAGTALVDGLWDLQQLVGGAALGLFNEYEDVVSRDSNKMLPMDGTIHPLTAQVLSYIKVGVSVLCVCLGVGGAYGQGAGACVWQRRLAVLVVLHF